MTIPEVGGRLRDVTTTAGDEFVRSTNSVVRLALTSKPEINVLLPHFGIAGDGVTQDASAINTLLAAATDGSVIRFPKASYLVNAQITYSAKKLTLIFEKGAILKESGTFTTPIIYLSNADGSVVRGLTVEGSETNFVGSISTRYALEAELSDDIVIERPVITGKSRGLLFDRCYRAKVIAPDITGLIHTNQLNGAINDAVTTVTVDSTTNFPASGTIRIDNEEITYTSKNATQFLTCTRAANSTTAVSHLDDAVVVEWVANRQAHTAVEVIDSNHGTFIGITVHDIGSAYSQGNSGPVANAGSNAIIGTRGRNCYDNGVYISSGNHCQVLGTYIEMDAGKRQTTGGTAVKVRGSHHVVDGGGCLGTYNGVAVSGDSITADGYGASGAETSVDNFVAYQCRGPGFHVPLNSGVIEDSPMRDVVFGPGCIASECAQDGGATGSVHVVGGIGVSFGGKVINHQGSTSTSQAIMFVGLFAGETDQLNGGIDGVVTTITVDSTSGFETSGTIRIGTEDITYTGITATDFTGCTRGANRTTAASHLDNVAVSSLLRCLRCSLTSAEITWPDTSPPACESVIVSYAADTDIDDLKLVNTNALGIRVTQSYRARITGMRPVNVTTTAVTVSPADSTAVDTLVEMVEGMTWVGGGSTTRVRWLGRRSLSVSAAYVLLSSNYDGVETVFADATSAAFTVTLPLAARSAGRRVTVIKTDATANAVTLDGSGAETVNGAANAIASNQYSAITAVCDGTSWYIPARAVVGTVYRLEGWVADDAQNPALGVIPANSYVLRAHVQTTEAFNSDGTDLLTVGYDADADAYVTALDVSGAPAILAPTLGVLAGYNGTARAVEAYYVNGGTEPTTGKALVVLEYTPVTTEIA